MKEEFRSRSDERVKIGEGESYGLRRQLFKNRSADFCLNFNEVEASSVVRARNTQSREGANPKAQGHSKISVHRREGRGACKGPQDACCRARGTPSCVSYRNWGY